jgi:hypothetical protein
MALRTKVSPNFSCTLLVFIEMYDGVGLSSVAKSSQAVKSTAKQHISDACNSLEILFFVMF